jgi:spore maturation protein CgeB
MKLNRKGERSMKILVYRWDMYPYDDIIHTLHTLGHETTILVFPIANHIDDAAFQPILQKALLTERYDLVFSVNYYAVIAAVCARYSIPYAAWTCDSPLLSLQHPSILFPTSYIFSFDKKEYETLCQKGAPHAYYLPLAGIDLKQSPAPVTPTAKSDIQPPDYDITFVGTLYDKNRYDEMCSYLPPYLCGYMDAAIEAQKNIGAGNLLPQMLSDDILADLAQYTAVVNGNASLEELRIHFATSVLSYKTAADIRTDALNLLARKHRVDLFTVSQTNLLWNVNCHPAVSYHTQMPEIFAHSKINLNFTIPNIENGICLRVFDVLSAGGFLLTDYREETCRLFTNGEELVVFDGIPDLLQKADYYLAHETERQRIAQNGQKKVHSLHSYEKRLTKLLQSIFPDK